MGWKTVGALALIVILIGAGAAIWVSMPKGGEKKLVIYTYNYFFGLTGDDVGVSQIYQKIFGGFEQKYGVKIELRFFDGARNILLQAVTEKKAGAKTADLLIGLDSITIQEAKKEGIVEKINVSELENLTRIRDDLITSFDPELYGVPYDFGPIAFVYDTKRINITTLTFDDFISKDWDKYLVVENPLTSTTGESFLLWEIAFYEKVLNKSWKDWWENVKDDIRVTSSWGEAYYDYFLNDKAGRPIVVSYLTSPVYHWQYEGTLRYKAILTTYNNRTYAWSQIQGAAIVKDSPMRSYALKFIDWLLSDEIQNLVALNDIMLPANTYALSNLPKNATIALGYNVSEIEFLNNYLNTTEIYNNISTWLDDWDSIFTSPMFCSFLNTHSTRLDFLIS
ncbi:MAG: thiamine ABC transporter substrate-binding protein [Candidatus Njordarchaeia archaeon]